MTEIRLSKDSSNNEYQEFVNKIAQFNSLSGQITQLLREQSDITITLNRIVKSAVDRSKLENEELRALNFPPFMVNNRQLWNVTDDVMSPVSMPEMSVPLEQSTPVPLEQSTT